MTQLPPFRLTPFFRTRIWGFASLKPWFDFETTGEPIGEVWLTGEMCKAATGPLAGMPLKQIAAEHGAALLGPKHAAAEFPLLIKVLFPKEKLSVQVHPDDAMAQRYGEPRGKTECWYALDAEPDAKVALGICDGVSAEAVRASIDDGTMEKLLKWLPVAKGDMIYVDAGTVHAIAPGAVLLETQQTSDLTYRMFDYGRPRELHLEKSMEAMRLETRAGKVAPRPENGHEVLVDEQYFRVERWSLESDALKATSDAVQMLFVAEGTGTMESRAGTEDAGNALSFDAFPVGKGQLAVIPAGATGWSFRPDGRSEVVRMLPRSY